MVNQITDKRSDDNISNGKRMTLYSRFWCSSDMEGGLVGMGGWGVSLLGTGAACIGTLEQQAEPTEKEMTSRNE